MTKGLVFDAGLLRDGNIPASERDIPTYPYCRKCLDKEKTELLIKAFGKSKNEAKAIVKMSAKTNWYGGPATIIPPKPITIM